MKHIPVFVVAVVVLLAGLFDHAMGAPGPETPAGKTVKPSWSYTYTTWSTQGHPMIVRVPLEGKRRATFRFGGAL